MNKFILVILLVVSAGLHAALSYDDAQFCLQKELWQILDKYSEALRDSALIYPSDDKWLNLYLRYSENRADTLSMLACLGNLALTQRDYDSAISWISLASAYKTDHEEYPTVEVSKNLLNTFTDPADNLLLDVYINGASEDSLYAAIGKLKHYNNYVEELAKSMLDMISVERNDSLAFALTQNFYASFPHSKWNQAVYYFELAHYISLQDYSKAMELIDEKAAISPAHTYIAVLYLLSPTLRRDLIGMSQSEGMLDKALILLNAIPEKTENIAVLYDEYNPSHWQARLRLQKAKALYYQLIGLNGYIGDEEFIARVESKKDKAWKRLWTLLEKIRFENNDSGEQAELAYWKGRTLALLPNNKSLKLAAQYFCDCLVYGAPRKKYDTEASNYLNHISQALKVKMDLIQWARSLKKYKGIVFNDITETAGFTSNRETRVAIGDYDNDSFADILLNGKRLYRNNGNLSFTELTDSLGLSELNANGGLFADFNLDGKLDFMTISHGDKGNGERLMKNMGGKFAPVNDRAGEIDDTYPTEGAAWADCFQDSYPDLYCSNYEKWQVQSGYEDRFWDNKKGYFTDKTQQYGFLNPWYTRNPGQAGRGVAPADFDNDGIQEIYVTNYRLDRNFLWDRNDTTFVDVAALDGLQGRLKKGYYGHSIGADWGDFDNDGDLDLFVANLAHPRYKEISDISMLLRNDGEMYRVIESDTIRYWQFTNITSQAGITYDELHSDPLWFDADNDGWFDLFITSVYENDRSYLYHNNGDGTFTDITWLSGVRVYNGWGNATADFDHDGRMDLVVGSGNGTKVFHNQTENKNQFTILKPVWDKGEIRLITSYAEMHKAPNSPAFGTRVMMKLKPPRGKEFRLIRELSSAKGTTSQSEQVLHFGLGRNKLLRYEVFEPCETNLK